MANPLIFQRLIPVLSLRTLATSSRGLKKDYPWSDYLEKLLDPSINFDFEEKKWGPNYSGPMGFS
jgi:hypothetical protein